VAKETAAIAAIIMIIRYLYLMEYASSKFHQNLILRNRILNDFMRIAK